MRSVTVAFLINRVNNRFEHVFKIRVARRRSGLGPGTANSRRVCQSRVSRHDAASDHPAGGMRHVHHVQLVVVYVCSWHAKTVALSHS
jgi:hypothetical protein